MRSLPAGEQAAIVGEVREEPPGRVLGRTTFGGHRLIDMLVGDPLPRIC
jgi:hydrogenase expression/formation protein HypE